MNWWAITNKLLHLLIVANDSSFFFFKQKTAYEMRISDWSSDVCSSDLLCRLQDRARRHPRRDDGLGRFRRGFGRQAPHGAGRRPVHRETADRGVPRTDGVGRDRRDPGYGRGRAHLLVGRDGVEGRRRDRVGEDRKSTRLNSST